MPDDPKLSQDAIKQLEDDARRIQAALVGMTKGLKIDEINQIAASFADFIRTTGESVSNEQLAEGAKNLQAIANATMGLSDKKDTAKAIDDVKILMGLMNTKGNEEVTSVLRMHRFKLEMNQLEHEKLAAQSEGGLAMIKAQWAIATAEIAEKSAQTFGGSVTGMIMPLIGALGVAAIVIKVLQAGMDQVRLGLDAIKPAMASTGAMATQSFAAYTNMVALMNVSVRSFEAVGFTADQASKLLSSAYKENAIQIGYNALAEQHYTGTIVERGYRATEVTNNMIFEMGRLSQTMFGTTENTKKLVDLSNLYNITNVQTLKIIGTGITQLAGIAGVDAGVLTDSFNDMGRAMMGTGVTVTETARTFIPLISNLRAFGASANLRGIELVELTKGLETLSKGVDTMKYMAVSGMTGNLEEMLGKAYATSPLARAKEIAEKSMEISAAGGYGERVAGLIGSKLGIGAGLSEPMQAQMTKFLATTKMEEYKGKSQEELARAMFGVKQGSEEFQSRVAAGELMGMDIQKQMLSVLEKSLGWLIKMATGIGDSANKQQARDELKTMNQDKQMAQTKGHMPYQNFVSATGLGG